MEEKIVVNPGTGFHGECGVVKADRLGITELPKDAKEIKPDSQGRLLVAHSESGHHHYIDDASNVTLYETSNPMFKFLQVEMDAHALLRHAKPLSDDNRHDTQKIGSGLYRIGTQREFTPEGWRAVQD